VGRIGPRANFTRPMLGHLVVILRVGEFGLCSRLVQLVHLDCKIILVGKICEASGGPGPFDQSGEIFPEQPDLIQAVSIFGQQATFS
jgi:hypothetical protein